MAGKFYYKRPVKADYIRKYGFEGERIWRLDLLSYTEKKNAYEQKEKNRKAFLKREKEYRK